MKIEYLGFARRHLRQAWLSGEILDEMGASHAWYGGGTPDYETLHKQALASREGFGRFPGNAQKEFHFILSEIYGDLRKHHPHVTEVILVGWVMTDNRSQKLGVQALPTIHIPLIRMALAIQSIRRIMRNQNRPTSTIPVTRQRGPALRKLVREAIHCCKIKNGDLVLLKAGTRLATEVNTNGLAEALSKQGFSRSIVAIVDSFDDLTVLDEAEMRKLGWQRVPLSAEIGLVEVVDEELAEVSA